MKELIQAISKTGFASAVTIFTGIVCTKVLALVTGPTGVGLINILRQMVAFFLIPATINGNNAIVQGISKRHSKMSQIQYQSVVFWLVALLTLATAAGMVLWARPIASYFFKSPTQTEVAVIRFLAVPTVLTAGSYYVKALINGYRAIGRLALVDVSAAVSTLLLVYPVARLIAARHNTAFILYLALPQLVAVIFGVAFLNRMGRQRILGLKALDRALFWSETRYFVSFSATLMGTGLMLQGTVLAIQAVVANQMTIAAVGVFSAGWALSTRYLSLVTNSFGTYYLPTLTGVRDAVERDSLICNMQRVVILLLTPLLVLLIAFKPMVVRLLYTEDFLPAVDIIQWMLIADYLRFSAWTVGMLLLSERQLKVFFWKEILLQLFLLGGSICAVMVFQRLEGIGIAYLTTMTANLLFLVWYARRRYRFTVRKDVFFYWISGLLIVLGTSLAYWRSTTMDMRFLIGIALAMALVYKVTTVDERRAVLSSMARFFYKFKS